MPDEHDVDRLTDLLSAACAGDAAALEELCRYFAPRLCRYVEAKALFGRGARVTAADDIVQIVLRDVVRDPATVLDQASLYRSEKRLRQRARWRVTDSVREAEPDRGESEVAGGIERRSAERPTTGPVTAADDIEKLRRLVSCLSGRPKQAIELIYFEGLDREQAARRLGISREAVRKALERASDELRRRYRPGA